MRDTNDVGWFIFSGRAHFICSKDCLPVSMRPSSARFSLTSLVAGSSDGQLGVRDRLYNTSYTANARTNMRLVKVQYEVGGQLIDSALGSRNSLDVGKLGLGSMFPVL